MKLGVISLIAAAVVITGCLDRPVGKLAPETTSLIVAKISQDRVDKIDLLFMIDNSSSMADKQAILQKAVPDLVGRLVNPVCVNNLGVPDRAATALLQPSDACPPGLGREFEPILDINVALITSSLGSFGANSAACKNVMGGDAEKEDMAELLGSLPRGALALAGESNVDSGGLGFLEWRGTGRSHFEHAFSKLISVTGEQGCGFEASLESWYRFLIDPEPYATLTPIACRPGDTGLDCRAPTGIDNAILAQRAAFLRPDSLVAVVMLTDENDCSVKAGGQAWHVAATGNRNKIWRAAALCETDPNNQCCYSCGQAPPAGCPADAACGDAADTGELGDYYITAAGKRDEINDPDSLRCFHQKQRFGVDFLYPTQRYSNALAQRNLCVTRDDLSEANCGAKGRLLPNPLYQVPTGLNLLPRDSSLVFLAGIVGVPWQDIVFNPHPGLPPAPDTPLKYQTLAQMAESKTWHVILGDGVNPGDPLMQEAVSARSGNSPVVAEALAPVTAHHMANSVNGHEWTPAASEDLQYACISPLAEPRDCAALTAAGDNRACDCDGRSATADGQHNKPLCQTSDSGYGFVQTYAKAYPGIRELDVLNKYGAVTGNSVVASICARNVSDPEGDDYGYRPAIDAIVDRLKGEFEDRCLPRPLALDDQGNVPCSIVEARTAGGGACDCNAVARSDVNPEAIPLLHRKMEQSGLCRGASCSTYYCLCEVLPTRGNDPSAPVMDAEIDCQNNNTVASSTNGWCYVDADRDIGNPDIVAKCPATAKRKLRFVGKGQLANGSTTFVACLGDNLASPVAPASGTEN